MGVVYLARQTELNRLVALKMILAGGHAGPEGLARFLAEAEAVAGLQHPNIVQLYEAGEHDGLPYFTLEYVAGGSLDQQAARHAAGRRRKRPRLVEQLAHGMDHAHQKRHRPPRPQAGQRAAGRGRHAQDHRLRHRQARRERRGHDGDRAR